MSKGFKKMSETSYVCLPKSGLQSKLHVCPSGYSIPGWYSMGLTDPCSCVVVPYANTMRKICPSPPLRGSFNYLDLPDFDLDKFAAAARFRGQWSDPRDFLRGGFKQKAYDDSAMFKNKMVRVGHTVLARVTPKTPFTSAAEQKETEPPESSLESNLESSLEKDWELEDALQQFVSADSQPQWVPEAATAIPGALQSLSALVNDYRQNQLQLNSFAASPNAPAVIPSLTNLQLEQINRATETVTDNTKEQPKPINLEQLLFSQKAQELNPPVSEVIESPEVDEAQQPVEQSPGLSPNWHPEPPWNPHENVNTTVVLPENILMSFLQNLPDDASYPEMTAEESLQTFKLREDVPPVQTSSLEEQFVADISSQYSDTSPVLPTLTPVQNTFPVPNFAFPAGNESVLDVMPDVDLDDVDFRWNQTMRQEFQKSAKPSLIDLVESSVKAPEAQSPEKRTDDSLDKMPVIIHTPIGRLVRIDPRYMDLSTLRKIFSHKEKLISKKALISPPKQKEDKAPQPAILSHQKHVVIKQDISVIGDSKRKFFLSSQQLSHLTM